MYWWNPWALWPSIDSNATDTFKTHKVSKDIVKIINVIIKIKMNNNQQFNRNFMKQQEYFLCAIKKTNDFLQQLFLFRVSLRRTFTRVHTEEKKWLNKVIIFVFVVHKMYHHCWTTDVPWNILMMSLLPFWVLNMSVALLFMGGS